MTSLMIVNLSFLLAGAAMVLGTIAYSYRRWGN